MTKADRLAPLVEWVNVDQEWEERKEENTRDYHRMQPREVRRLLQDFVDRFADDKVAAGAVTHKLPSEWAWIDTSKPPFRADLSKEEHAEVQIEVLRCQLGGILQGDKGDTPVAGLSFRVDRAKGKTRLLVSGPLPFVLLYLAARLVVEYDVVIVQCQAPEADVPGRHERNWAKWPRCTGVLVAGGHGVGRRYCSTACKKRAENPNWKKQLKRRKL